MIAQAIGEDKSVVSRELKRNRNEKEKHTFSYDLRIWQIFVMGARQPKNRVEIEQRPLVLGLNRRFGDWKMDTIVGKNGKGAILTLVERTTAFCMAKKLPKGKNAKELSKIVYTMLLPYKEHVHTITVDNGSEFADHQTLAKKLHTQIYFTHLYSSWEKGLIENTNKLIRQYIPKKTNFNEFSNNIIKQIQYRINERPRYKLNIYSPKEIFFLDLKQKVAVTS